MWWCDGAGNGGFENYDSRICESRDEAERWMDGLSRSGAIDMKVFKMVPVPLNVTRESVPQLPKDIVRFTFGHEEVTG